MKKAKAKKSAAKRAATPAKPKATPAAAARGNVKNGLVQKQPQVKQQAAVAHGMFLHTDDAWSLHYYDPNDLHFKERQVFG